MRRSNCLWTSGIRSAVKAVITVSAVISLAAACSGKSKTASPARLTSSVPSSTASSTQAPTGSPTDTGGSSSAGDGGTASATDSSTAPAVLPTNASGRPLTLADVFTTTGTWKDDRFSISSHQDLKGIGTSTSACSPDNASVLELRLADGFSKLTMTAGQDNDSASSDEVLIVDVVANGTQIDTRHIKFDALQSFTENVRGVNALQIRVYLDTAKCVNKEVTAVIEGLIVS